MVHNLLWDKPVKCISCCVSGNNDAEEESDEDEDYVPSEDWKKVVFHVTRVLSDHRAKDLC